MKVKVLGLQTVDYVSRKSGNPVKGITLHAVFKDSQVTGDAVGNIFISDNLNLACAKQLAVGQIVDVVYNNRGFVCDAIIEKLV